MKLSRGDYKGTLATSSLWSYLHDLAILETFTTCTYRASQNWERSPQEGEGERGREEGLTLLVLGSSLHRRGGGRC